MEMTNWKTLCKKESWGEKNFGIEVRVAVDRDFTDADKRLSYRIADEIEEAIMRETMRLDPEKQKELEEESAKLMECFGGRNIYASPIPNGYCSRWCCSMRPWYRVTTSKGVFVVGWRKSVISIEWEPHNSLTADVLFPDEDVTKGGYSIHAWGYGKAKQYIDRILA
jgi:hypothetical protein